MKKSREGYKMSELGEIPSDWEIISLESLGEFKNGINKGKDDFGFGVKFVNIQDAYIGNSIVESRLGRLNVNEKEKEIYKLINGDIVVVRSSVKPEGVGYPILFDGAQEDVVYCGFMIRYRYNIDKVNPLFMLYQLRSSKARKQVLDLSTVSANTNINQESYKKVKIILPTKKEQEKIASILSTVDEQIDNVDALIEKNKELKKGLMQTLLTKGIGHTKFKKTEIGEIPEEWEVKKLGDIFKLSSGNFLSQKNIVDGCYPVYGGNGVNGYHNEYMFQESKLVIGRVGAKCGCVCLSQSKAWITDNALYISEKIKEFDDKYMYYLLDSINLNSYANQNAQPVISGQKIYGIYVAFPNINEQIKIIKILSQIDEKIEEYENKKKKLEELKKGLMQQLLTGMIRVTV